MRSWSTPTPSSTLQQGYSETCSPRCRVCSSRRRWRHCQRSCRPPQLRRRTLPHIRRIQTPPHTRTHTHTHTLTRTLAPTPTHTAGATHPGARPPSRCTAAVTTTPATATTSPSASSPHRICSTYTERRHHITQQQQHLLVHRDTRAASSRLAPPPSRGAVHRTSEAATGPGRELVRCDG
jgi:hypothetical protein